jgi:putative transposase
MKAQLVCDALQMAIWQRKPNVGLVHHFDRGSQYASKAFRQLLTQHSFKGSMSRKGNCWDTGSVIKVTDNFRLTHAGIEEMSLC